jgi:hypothetical protein
MRLMPLVILAGTCSVAAACPQAPAQAVSGPEGKRMHVETTFEVLVHAPYAETAELFSPEGERAWAGDHWDPQFLYPVPARDKQGAVFTISHGLVHAVWVVSQHDLEARHFQYVYFTPELLVTMIDARFQLLDSKTTLVTVTYARTGISPDGDEHVKSMSEGDQAAGKDWQEAINQYLKSRAPAPAT